MSNNNQVKENQYPQFQQPVQNQTKSSLQNNTIEGQIKTPFPQFILPLQNKTQQQNPIIQKITIEGDTYEKFQPPIGQGSEGIVYKGKNIKTQEIVAIKEYKLINQNELKAIQAIQRNNFSHIIGIKGVQIQQNSCPIIAMEFAHGEFYQFMISPAYQKLTYNERNSYFLQMVQGVEQLHSIQLFHRDLKPENFVYIKDSNNKMTIKLIDFGLVKETQNQMVNTSKVGTPYYMAPEILGNQNCFYNKSVDIWSLGAMWYELLTDNTFFQGNTQDEIFFRIHNYQQNSIDQQIQNNNNIQQQEKDLIKKMLKKEPTQRIQLKDVLQAYTVVQIIPNKINFLPPPYQVKVQCKEEQFNEAEQRQKENEQIQKEIQLKKEEEIEKKLAEFEQKKQEEMAQMKREMERQLEIKFAQQQYNKEDLLKKEYEEQIKQKEKELQELRVEQEKAHQYEKDQKQLAQIKIQLEMQIQNEMEQFKKQKHEEQNIEVERIKQQAQIEKNQEIQQQLQIKEQQLKQQLEADIQKKYMLDYNNKVTQLEDQKKYENQKQLEEISQSLMIQLKSQQTTINTFIQNLNEKLRKINEINTEDQKKQQLSNYIDKELGKYQDQIIKNQQRLLYIQQAQTKETLKGYDIQLAQENQQYIQEYNVIIDKITKEQSLLEQKVKDKEISDQQRREQEQKLKKEKDQYESLFIIVKQQSSQQSLQIKTISEQIKYYQRIKLQIQGEEKIQDVINQQQIITQDIQVLEQQERIIQQFDQLQLIPLYQQCNNKLEELQQSQNRLKILIEEANKCLKQIDSQYLDEHQQQIDNLNDILNDQLDKFKHLSKYQKYKDKINQIINKIADESGKLNSLEIQISQRTQVAYQQYNQNQDQIQQSISDFQKQYNQLHEQIYNDEQIEQKNGERIKKLKMTQYQLDLFKNKMNQLKEQVKSLINNQYFNNEQTQNLINNRLARIDYTIFEYQKQFDKFNEINELNSLEIITYQINQLEEFQRKFKEVENNETEQVDQLQKIIQKIGAENKSEQEKEIINQNIQLQNRYKEFSKALQSIKFQSESIEFYKKENEKRDKLDKQLKEEIKILEEYLEIQNLNTQLFNQELNDIKIKKGNQKQQIEEIIKKLQQTNKQKGDRLNIVTNKVFEKQIEINFTQIDDNLIKNYEQLKTQEEQLQKELNQITDKISNQQLNPQQLNELKDQIIKVNSKIYELQTKIPKDIEVKEFNQNFQYNLESYEKQYALVNYIKQYHLTRYYERIKVDENNSKKKKQDNNQNDYRNLFLSRLNQVQEENTKKEKEAQDILQRYEYALNENQKKMAIQSMEKDQEEIEKQIQIAENLIKSKDQVKLRSKLKDQSVIKEIINAKQYYKITEFACMQIFNSIINKQTIQQGQINQY